MENDGLPIHPPKVQKQAMLLFFLAPDPQGFTATKKASGNVHKEHYNSPDIRYLIFDEKAAKHNYQPKQQPPKFKNPYHEEDPQNQADPHKENCSC